MPRTIIVYLLLLCGTDAYFSYDDCNPDCIHYKACCTIQEITPNYFPSLCTDTQEICENLASPEVVCIRPDDVPLGGSELWPRYDEYKQKHHHPPSTTARPSMKPDCKKWKTTVVIVASVILLALVQKSLSVALRYFRTRAYENISPRPENPIYARTVEDIDAPQSSQSQ